MPDRAEIALVLPEHICKKMFRDNDMACLHKLGHVVGPVGAEDPHAIAEVLAHAEIAVTGWGSPKFDQALLAQAPLLRLVAHTAGSVKSMVTEAVFARDILVTTAASANAVPVAQYTLAMMVSLLKQVPWLTSAYSRNDGAEVEKRRAVVCELEDLTVAIIGASRVGREVVRLLKSYPNIDVICYDPYLSNAAAAELGVRKATLQEACRCPVVSIHAPNIAETRHMFNAHTLAMLPDHAVLINTSRGALVDEAALISEVKRRPLYVMLDVTDPEPAAADSPIRKQPNILITPHIAGAMNQSCKNMGRLAVEEIRRFVAGEKLQHAVTRQMLATQA